MILIRPSDLTDFVTRIFHSAGASEPDARRVAASLVSSNLTGHDSHGVIRVTQYLAAIERGDLDAGARPVIASEMGAITKVDGRHGFGQVAAHFAMELSIAKARQHGLAATTLQHSNHVGRLGEWVHMAAEQNQIGLAFCNCGPRKGWVTPYGGAARALGTDPIAAAVPIAGRPPFLLDFATSVRAEGKVRVARSAGQRLPDGWILDMNGQPSTDPHDLYNGGMLLPAAGHKGYALALLAELLGGILTGQGAPGVPGDTRFRNGVLFVVLALEPFRPLADFLAESAMLAQYVKATPRASGFEEILLPGEPEARTAARRQVDGVPLDDATWSDLEAAGKGYGLEVPPLLT